MSNLLDKASIILTPTAYNNGEALCVKPSDGSGDFDFSRNSAATRVNAQGLVENVQILSSNLVQNGDFSEEGVQEVSNGSFSQEGSELVTNGDFATDSDWSKDAGWTISNGTASCNGSGVNSLQQSGITTVGKVYKLTFDVLDSNDFDFLIISTNFGDTYVDADLNSAVVLGRNTFYIKPTNGTGIRFRVANGTTLSIDNVSVREVGQDWSLGSGWSIGEDKAVFDGGSDNNLSSASSVTNGKSYKYSFTISDMTTGALSFRLGSASNNDLRITEDGTYSGYAVADGTSILFRAESGFDGSITNISVKEVGQNWTLGSGWSIGEDKAICDGSGFGALSSSYSNFNSKKLKVNFDILNYVSGEIRVPPSYRQDGLDIRYSANGSYELIYNSINSAFALNTVNFNGSVTNISVIEITDDTNLPRINYEGFSYQDALGSELVTNGDFSTDSDWTLGNNTTISGGKLINSNSSAFSSTRQSIPMSAGTYLFTYTIDSISGGGFFISFTGFNGITRYAAGTYSEYVTLSSASTTIFLAPVSSGMTYTIDNVSVKEYLGQEVVPNSGCGSWLWEPQSTNLITQSELFSDASWFKAGASVTSGFTSPSGAANAFKLVEDTSTGTHRIIRSSITVSNNSTISNSIFVKKGGRDFVRLSSYDGTSGFYAYFDLNNGVIGTVGTDTTATITEMPNGWYKCTTTFTIVGTNLLYELYACEIDNAVSYQGDGTSGIYIWGAQLEQQSYATSYIPTSGSTVTRNQDVCTNGATGTGLINSTEGVLYWEGKTPYDNTASRRISLSDGSISNRVSLEFDEQIENKLKVFITRNGASETLVYDAPNLSIYNKIAIKWKANDFQLWFNGSEVVIVTIEPRVPVGLTELSFNGGNNANNFYGKTKALAVWKEALSDSELQNLTTI